MLKPVRRVAVTWVKPIVGDDTWRSMRRLNPARRRAERQRALEAKVTREVRRQLSLEQQKEAERSLFRASRGLGLTRSLRDLLAEVDTLLAKRPKAKVAVIATEEATVLPALIGGRYGSAKVMVVPRDLDESGRHVFLAAHGRFDLIIEATSNRDNPAGLMSTLFFHLTRGGHLAVANLWVDQPAPHGLWALLDRLVAVRAALEREDGDLKPRNADEEAMAKAISRIVLGNGFVVVQNKTESLAKLREVEMAPLLALTGTRFGSVLERIEAEKFEPRSLIRDHRSDTEVRVQAEISVPALELRSYSDVMSAPPQVVSKDNLLLVETYRHHLYPRMANRMITENAPRFGQIRRDVTRPVPIAGTYFHWDSEWPGHYGHVLTEQVSKLWGLEGARRRHPDLKVLLGRRPRETRAMSFERAILAAVGVPEEDILLYDKPVRIQRLIAATPMFSMPDYVSPRVHETWNFLGREIVTQASDRPTPRRIFCGRQRNNRSCLNAGEVEATFTEFGFEVVFPEHMSFPDQIAMFRNAEVVAGYAGSALFTVMFCDDPKPMIMLAPESYMGCNNEYLIAAVLGNSIDVFWSVPEGASSIAPYYVDFQREGRLLREHLRSLG